jgi:hypothetical protein
MTEPPGGSLQRDQAGNREPSCTVHSMAPDDLERWFTEKADLKDTLEDMVNGLWEKTVIAPMLRLVEENAPTAGPSNDNVVLAQVFVRHPRVDIPPATTSHTGTNGFSPTNQIDRQKRAV